MNSKGDYSWYFRQVLREVKANNLRRERKGNIMSCSLFGYHLAIVFYWCGWYIGYKYYDYEHHPPGQRVLRKQGEPIFISLGVCQIRFYPRVGRNKAR